MKKDFPDNLALQPTLSSLLSHFDSIAGHRPAPIKHPESLAFKTRNKTDHASAAVLIPIVSAQDQLQVLLTKRAKHLRHHPGQISFPGGASEPHDVSLIETAIRETHEEVGITADQVQVLGQLGDYYTVSGYRVTPVIGLIRQLPTLTLDANEVCETLTTPFNFLMNPNNFTLCDATHEGVKRSYYSVTYGGHHIWGVTAGIIMALYEALRESHLNQADM